MEPLFPESTTITDHLSETQRNMLAWYVVQTAIHVNVMNCGGDWSWFKRGLCVAPLSAIVTVRQIEACEMTRWDVQGPVKAGIPVVACMLFVPAFRPVASFLYGVGFIKNASFPLIIAWNRQAVSRDAFS